MDTIILIGLVITITGVLVVAAVLLMARSAARQREQMPGELASPANLAAVDNAVIAARLGGQVVFANPTARRWFDLDGAEPDLWQLAQRVERPEAFLQLFAAEGKAGLTLAGRQVDATSHRVVADGEPHFVVVLKEKPPLPTLSREERGSGQAIQVTAEVLRDVNASLELDPTLRAILEGVQRLVICEAAQVYLWHAGDEVLKPAARIDAAGYEAIPPDDAPYYRRDQGYPGWIARKRQPLLLEDTSRSDPLSRTGPLIDPRVGSYLGVPLVVQSRLVGTLEATSSATHAFNTDDQAMLSMLAEQAAIALDNARAYQSQAGRVEELAGLQRVAESISVLQDPERLYARLGQRLAEVMGTEMAGVLLYDRERQRLVAQKPVHGMVDAVAARFIIPLHRGSPARGVWEDVSYWFTNNAATDHLITELNLGEIVELAGTRSIALAVMSSGDERSGVLYVANRADGRPFSMDDIRLLQTYAMQAAIVVESARLYAQEQTRVAELQGLQQIVQAMSAFTNPDELYGQLVTRIADLLGVGLCGILLYDSREEHLAAVTPFHGLGDDLAARLVLPVRRGLAREVWREHELYLSNGVFADETIDLMGLRELARTTGLRTVMLAPLSAGGRRFGMLQVANKLDGTEFEESDERLIKIFAGQAAALIENARLYQDTDATLRQRAQELRSVARVSHELNATLELERILTAIAAEARRAEGARWARLVAYEPASISLGDASGEAARELEEACAASGTMLVVEDFERQSRHPAPVAGARSALLVPVHFEERVVGVISLYGDRPQALGRSAAEYVQALASQATSAITNATRHAEQVAHAAAAAADRDRLQQLHLITTALQQTRSLQDRLAVIARGLRSVGWGRVAVMLLDAEQEIRELVTAGYSAEDESRLRDTLLPGSLWAHRFDDPDFVSLSLGSGFYLRHDHPWVQAHVKGLSGAPNLGDPDLWHPDDQFYLPMYAGTEIIGVVNLRDPADGRRPTVGSVRPIELFMQQAASALENTRLYHETLALQSYNEAVVQSIQQGIIVTDAAGAVETVNAFARQQYGWGDDLTGRPLAETKPGAGLGLREDIKRVLAGGEPVERTGVLYPAGGETHHLNVTVYPRYEDETITGTVILLEDVSQRARLEADIAQRGRQLAALNDASRRITAALSVEEVVQAALDEAERVIAYDRATLWLRVPDQPGKLELRSARGKPAPFPGERVDMKAVPAFAQILRENEPFISDYGPGKTQGKDKPRSWMGVPMVSGSEILGILVFEKREAHTYAPADGQVAAAFANQVAVAVENARLFEEAGERAEALQARSQRLALLNRVSSTLGTSLDQTSILQAALDELTGALGADYGGVVMLDDLNAVARLELQSPSNPDGSVDPFAITLEDNPAVEQLLATRAPLPVDDVQTDPLVAAVRGPLAEHGIKSTLLIPLITGNALIAIIMLNHTQERRAFEPEQIELAQTISNQAAISVQNAQLFQETVARQRELGVLSEAGRVLASSLDLYTVAANAAKYYLQSLDVAGCAVSMLDDDAGLLTLVEQQRGQVLTRPGERRAIMGLPTVQRIIEAREGMMIRGATAELGIEQFEWMSRRGIRSMMVLPLLSRDEVIGLVELWYAGSGREFEDREMRLGRALSAVVATAMQNARLYNQMVELSAELEQRVEERTGELRDERDRIDTLYRIAVELTASLDLDMVLSRAVTLVGEAVGAQGGMLLLVDPQSDQLIHRASMNPAAPLPPGGQRVDLRADEGLIGWLLQNRQSVIVDDVQEDPRWPEIPGGEGKRSLIGTPLIANDVVLGCILFDSDQPAAFYRAQLRLVEAAANQVAGSINNAELYRMIREQAERLGAMLRSQQTESAKSQAILESIADGVMVTDQTGEIILFNAAAEQVLGLQRDHALGRPASELRGLYGPGAQRWTEALETWRTDPSSHEGALLTEQIEVEGRVIAVHVSPVLYGRDYLGLVSVFRDITREVEADRLKSEFVARVSHELRTPLTSIKGYADLLLMGAAGNMTDNQRGFLDTVRNNADRLRLLVDDLLDISRIEQGHIDLDIQPTDVRQIINEVLEALRGRMAQEGRTVDVTAELDADTPLAEVDSGRIMQVVTNLVDNAYSYTPDEGKVTVRAMPAGDGVQIDVVDTGIGIPEADQTHVFERFFRGESNPTVFQTAGTGLGLSIVQQIVEMHQGRVWLESVEGQGSTFSVWLPCVFEGVVPQAPYL